MWGSNLEFSEMLSPQRYAGKEIRRVSVKSAAADFTDCTEFYFFGGTFSSFNFATMSSPELAGFTDLSIERILPSGPM